MATLGLACIIAGWLLQLFTKNGKIQKPFVGIYCIGTLLLIVDGAINGSATIVLLNVLIFGVAVMVFYRLFKRK